MDQARLYASHATFLLTNPLFLSVSFLKGCQDIGCCRICGGQFKEGNKKKKAHLDWIAAHPISLDHQSFFLRSTWFNIAKMDCDIFLLGFQARSFEVTAMHSAMERSKDASAERAFQSLPRHLRRRAASHNIKRLPVRLRERARREVSQKTARASCI